MKEAATKLQGEARRKASILYQTPRWRGRRKLCLTERTQQCQSGPTTKAWFHDRCNRVERDACRQGNVMTRVRHRQSTCEEQRQNWRETLAGEATLDACEASSGARAGSTAAWKWEARASGTARRVRIAPPERDPRGSGQHSKNLEDNAKRHAGSIGSTQVAASEPVRVAPPDGIVWTCAGSTARK